jgi:hypothetical protein
MEGWTPTYSRAEVEDAVVGAKRLSGALRRLGLRVGGGNRQTLRKLIAHYGIATEHFDPSWYGGQTIQSRSVDEILVEHSAFNRGHLKSRLYDSGLKQRRCELCRQDEEWHGRRMSLILDHINGAGDDNRLENLRIVCANCNEERRKAA